MNEIGIYNETNDNFDEFNELKNLTDFLVKYMKLDNVVFNIIIVDNKTIHEINKKYRNVDRPTDVISFAFEDNKENIVSNIRVLGDIYISIDKARSQAKEYGHSLKREICFLSVHGFLHLLGYDHQTKEDEEKMFSLQEDILNKYGVKR